jgi:non-ribosomal peptide synthase protein (TIGR01720 family)
VNAPKPSRIGVREVLLTGLAEALAAWTGRFEWLVEIEDHGRDEELVDQIDLSRTVGWFTCFYPLALRHPAAGSPLDAAREIAAAVQAMSRRRATYGLLRYLTREPGVPDALRGQPAPEVRFNYLGTFDTLLHAGSLFGPCPESAGPWRARAGLRTHPIEIEGAIIERRLRLQVKYSANLHHVETIEALARHVIGLAKRLAERWNAPRPDAAQAADLELASLKEGELRTIVDELRAATAEP